MSFLGAYWKPKAALYRLDHVFYLGTGGAAVSSALIALLPIQEGIVCMLDLPYIYLLLKPYRTENISNYSNMTSVQTAKLSKG